MTTGIPAIKYWTIQVWTRDKAIISLNRNASIVIEFTVNEYDAIKVIHHHNATRMTIKPLAMDEFFEIGERWWKEFYGEDDEVE